jgi:hypothetical protein
MTSVMPGAGASGMALAGDTPIVDTPISAAATKAAAKAVFMRIPSVDSAALRACGTGVIRLRKYRSPKHNDHRRILLHHAHGGSASIHLPSVTFAL